MNKNFILGLLATIILLGTHTDKTQAQESFIKGRWNVRVKGAPQLDIKQRRHYAYLMVGLNYGFHPNLEAGLDFGFQNADVLINTDGTITGQSFIIKQINYPIYNLHLNYHLFPYLAPGKNLRFDGYITSHLGGSSYPEQYYGGGFFMNFFLGTGLSWYFTRHVGLNVEAGRTWGLQKNSIGYNKLMAGLIVKF